LVLALAASKAVTDFGRLGRIRISGKFPGNKAKFA
jgi:hypothetical protein